MQKIVTNLWFDGRVEEALGGEKGQCGWLTDRFGVSWQVVPIALIRMLEDEDEVKTQRVTQAMLAMTKLDIAALERAYHGE